MTSTPAPGSPNAIGGNDAYVAPSTRVTVPDVSSVKNADPPSCTTPSRSPALVATETEAATCSDAPSINVTKPTAGDANHAPPPDRSTTDDAFPSPATTATTTGTPTTTTAKTADATRRPRKPPNNDRTLDITSPDRSAGTTHRHRQVRDFRRGGPGESARSGQQRPEIQQGPNSGERRPPCR